MMELRQWTEFKTERVFSIEELKRFFVQLLPHIPEKCIFLFYGEVGAGKTESVKALAEAMKLGAATSPSFAIHHRYENSTQAMDHVDLYRLNDEDELESSGFWDLFQQAQALIVVEWPERLNPDWLPANWPIFEFQFTIEASPTSSQSSLQSLVLGSRVIRYRQEIFKKIASPN